MDKFHLTEFMGGGEPIVTIACHKKDWIDLIEQRNELLRLAKAVVKEHKFCGHAIADSESVRAMERYVEAIK